MILCLTLHITDHLWYILISLRSGVIVLRERVCELLVLLPSIFRSKGKEEIDQNRSNLTFRSISHKDIEHFTSNNRINQPTIVLARIRRGTFDAWRSCTTSCPKHAATPHIVSCSLISAAPSQTSMHALNRDYAQYNRNGQIPFFSCPIEVVIRDYDRT